MNNDLSNEAVVDTGKPAATAKKRSSGQHRKSSDPQKTAVKNSQKAATKNPGGNSSQKSAAKNSQNPNSPNRQGGNSQPHKRNTKNSGGQSDNVQRKTYNAKPMTADTERPGKAVAKAAAADTERPSKAVAKAAAAKTSDKPKVKQYPNTAPEAAKAKPNVKKTSSPEDIKLENEEFSEEELEEIREFEEFDEFDEEEFDNEVNAIIHSEKTDNADKKTVQKSAETPVKQNKPKNSAKTAKSEKSQNPRKSSNSAKTAKSAALVISESSDKTDKPEKKRRRPLFLAVPIVAAVVILTAGVIISAAALGIFDTTKHEAFVATEQSGEKLSSPQGKFLEGISVQGVDLGGKTMTQAQEILKAEESKLIPSINYTLRCRDQIVYLTEDDFEFKFDTVKVLNEAYEYSEYMREVLMDKGRANMRGSERKAYTITLDFPEESIRAACEEAAKKVDVEMQNAHVTNIDTSKAYVPDMFSFAEGVVGYSLDVDDLVTQIKTLKKQDNYTADLIGQMKVTEPQTDLEDLLKNLVLISKYTTFSGNTWAGNMNMTVAMESMNGSIIKPGEVFSFNGKTGDSNLVENGYYSAGVIVNGASADGIGGGICQAATTIYNAAIRAGMTIVEREPHTWPSVYVPVGIDSAIDYGAIDMKFRNDTDHEVYLICYMDGATLYAYIYGYKPADFDEIVVSSWFTGGTGIGFGASACRNYYKGGKLVKTEDLPDSFYSNGGGTSYAFDEPLANYVFERVYSDKKAAKLAAKIEEESKTKATKDAKKEKTSDTDKDSDKDKSTDSEKTADVSADIGADYTEDYAAEVFAYTEEDYTDYTAAEDYEPTVDDTVADDFTAEEGGEDFAVEEPVYDDSYADEE